MRRKERLTREELEDTLEYLKEIIKITPSEDEIIELRLEIRKLSNKIEKMLEYQAKKNYERFLHDVVDYATKDGWKPLGTPGCYRAVKRNNH